MTPATFAPPLHALQPRPAKRENRPPHRSRRRGGFHIRPQTPAPPQPGPIWNRPLQTAEKADCFPVAKHLPCIVGRAISPAAPFAPPPLYHTKTAPRAEKAQRGGFLFRFQAVLPPGQRGAQAAGAGVDHLVHGADLVRHAHKPAFAAGRRHRRQREHVPQDDVALAG